MKKTIALILSLLTTGFADAQEKDKKWDVANPGGSFKEITFTTNEGTWMNLDTSPDGKELVFDMLGDIYSMPTTGGEAKVLRSGLPFEVQPRFSPDGKKISFTSDAAGGDNIWVMNRDGSGAKQITKESFRLLNNAIWTPDGQYLIARKHFTATRSLGAGELWMYHSSGGEGLQLTKRKNDQQDVNEPTISPDGRYVYYAEDMYPGGFFQYNKDPNSQIYVIKQFDRQTGKTEDVISGPGGAARPQISRDGKKLAFVRRVREKSVLYLHDLQTGEEWPLFDGLSKDQQEAWAIFGVYTNFNWMPDNTHIIIWGKGKFWKVNASNGTATEIPFTVQAKHQIAEAVRFSQEVAPDNFTAKAIRHAVTSPDEKLLLFNAAGYLWKKELPNGTPVRLTNATDFEFEPSFSPKGDELVYVTWNDEQSGAIYKLNIKNSKAKPVKITTGKGIYRTPSYSPDGKQLVFIRETGNAAQGFTHTKDAGIYRMPAAGGEATLVIDAGSSPRFNATGTRIFYQTGGGLEKAFKSADLNGKDEIVHFTSKYANQFVPSPDDKWIAFTELFKAYIAPMPQSGQIIDLTNTTKAVPVAQVSRDAGINLHWSADSKKLHWTLGEEYFTNDLKNRFTFVEGASDSLPPIDTTGLKINLVVKSDKPEGQIALKGARIITMNGEEVIENGTIVVEGNRIIAIGTSAAVQIPAKAKVIDVTGKTIMPGIVDVHAHMGTFRQGLSPQKQPSYYANLAYGVTTTHDPSSNTEMVFSQSEMVKAGNMIGPRIYSTGTVLYGADGDFKAVINTLEDARSALRRTKAFGAFSVKSYNQPRREQRQQVIQAARELNMLVVPEGGSHFFHNMSMILDGHTGIEHNIPVAPLYTDVLKLWSASKTGYTPTLIVNYGGLNGEYYWYQKTNVWEKERLLNFTPRSVVDSRSRHRTMVPDEEYTNGHILVSQSCKKLTDAGVKVNLGAHGQLQGLGAHWELWMLQQGGMSNMEALRAATLNGAEYLGLDKDLGSLAKGKLADLIILEKNPLENIQHTESIQYTMINGRLLESETLNEVGNYDRKRSKFYWENTRYSQAFPWHEDSHSFMESNCSCRH
ncbi:amidohydrolase family protein [Rhodocytophaga aerolata]|uniref:Amidohydrolase family protein n=1 Tax=Rhodocytophaga aerolata TaxID=455078 RepID=A0ABT8RD64_9BACT|nr:amidohydrolase family protein [Rhodocytophaga aerolata]MDO1450036.1 amidohydrolase family protein [Rhodocytophaga aerolata]